MMSGVLFQVANVCKHLGAFTLNIDNLDVRAGEVLGLLGPTGAGKTTLLRLLANLLDVDIGELRFDGRPYGGPALPLSVRRRITLVHQRPLLLSGPVRFNVEYGLRLRGELSTGGRVDRMLKQLELRDLASQDASTLSGGQVQLVALARALVIEPDVLLLDEPTAHLDPAHVALVEETIQQVRQERTMTVCWATHNMFQARRVASRTALLLDGQLVELQSTDEFFANPSDPRTLDFVQGRMIY